MCALKRMITDQVVMTRVNKHTFRYLICDYAFHRHAFPKQIYTNLHVVITIAPKHVISSFCDNYERS